MDNERIHGLSLRDCAEIMAKSGELKAQHGERAAAPLFAQYLAQRGASEHVWAESWNGWWTRMQADPSGQLSAKFAMIQQELTMAAHFADVPDASNTAHEGVTLDTYARLMAEIAAGKDPQQLLAGAGIGWDQWQRAQNAWNAAMAADTNHHLTTQYGQLYAKHTPGFQERMQGQIAATMAADHAQRAAGRPDEPEREYTFDDMERDLSNATPNTRWSAAHHIANRWDIGDRGDARLAAAANKASELAVECLERHDAFTASNAEALARDLKMFAEEGLLGAERAADAKGTLERCRNRADEQLRVARAAFAPIANKAVPERVKMQSQIQDFESLLETLNDLLGDWPDSPPEPSMGASAPAPSAPAAWAPSAPSVAPVVHAASEGGGLLAFLKSLPILGALLRALGL